MNNILTINGGGIHGLVPLSFLVELEAYTGKRTAEMFNYIGGTSTGGIIAAMLSCPSEDKKNSRYSAQTVMSLYIKLCKEVFKKNFFRNLSGIFLKSTYSRKALDDNLDELLGNVMMSDTLVNLLIPAYDIKNRAPVFFTRKDGYTLAAAAKATSSAPTYFPAFKYEGMLLVDGGIFANNPAVCTLSEYRNKSNYHINFLLSLGTGEQKRKSYTNRDMNLLDIAKAFPDWSIDASVDTTEFILRQILSESDFAVINTKINDNIEIDATGSSSISQLISAGKEMFCSNFPKITKIAIPKESKNE